MQAIDNCRKFTSNWRDARIFTKLKTRGRASVIVFLFYVIATAATLRLSFHNSRSLFKVYHRRWSQRSTAPVRFQPLLLWRTSCLGDEFTRYKKHIGLSCKFLCNMSFVLFMQELLEMCLTLLNYLQNLFRNEKCNFVFSTYGVQTRARTMFEMLKGTYSICPCKNNIFPPMRSWSRNPCNATAFCSWTLSQKMAKLKPVRKSATHLAFEPRMWLLH